jgi:pilus assembly protein Flp/PilA
MLGLDIRTTFRAIASAPRLRSQNGQGMVEYGLLVSLVAVALVAALLALSGQLALVFDSITTTFNTVVP